MTICLVGIGLDSELLRGGTTLNVHALALGALLGQDRGNRCFAKLHLGFEAKQALNAGDEATVGGQTHITHFKTFKNVVFLALEVQFYFVFEGKGCLCVKIKVEVEAVAQLARRADLHFLVKVKGEGPAISLGNNGIFNMLVAQTKPQLRTAGWANFEFVRTKNIAKNWARYAHIGNEA